MWSNMLLPLLSLPLLLPNTLGHTVPRSDGVQVLEERAGQKYIFMHHIVGRPRSYPYTQNDWADDIRQIQARGVDAIALNLGPDDWQRNQVASAYAAAQSIGATVKLFLSFDFTAFPSCNVADFVGRVNQFGNHPNQFKYNGKTFISSFSGDCLGNGGWQSLKDQTNGYLMPTIFGIEGQFNNWPSLDAWFCWGCAWPKGNANKTPNVHSGLINYTDRNQLGSRFATTVSPWFYTHYSYKNWYYRGDDFLFSTRWEQLMSIRDSLTFVEIVSWNDYGESHYMGPIKGAQPAGTNWANGFPHTAFYDLAQYYIKAFHTGSYPAVTEDVIYYWARPHPAQAHASSDSLGPPDGYTNTADTLWAIVLSTSSSSVTLTCGSSTRTFNVGAGLSKLQIPLAPGKITVSLTRNGQKIINQSPGDYNFITNPSTYNYNAYVGAARK